jgi:hypothetical protein
MVYETLAEGGITRYMAVYLNHDAPLIGPIRSTRVYFNAWAAGLGAILAHDGGNVDALQELPSLTNIFNIDADLGAISPFQRIVTRFAPHNEYTSTEILRSYAQEQGAGAGSVFSTVTPPLKHDAPTSQRPSAFSFQLNFSYGDYNVAWLYDPKANDFLRFIGGAPDVDAQTHKQLTAKNVVVMTTDETPASDPFTLYAIHMRTEGLGKVTVYEDGKAIQGTWSKPFVQSPLQWLGGNGQPIPLDSGNTWVEVLPVGATSSPQTAITPGSTPVAGAPGSSR